MSQTFSLVGWADCQHYKNDTPPWVKLHGKTLTSITWIKGSDRDRMMMIACMMLAARYANKIPMDYEILQPAAALKCTEKQMFESLEYLKASEFIEYESRQTLETEEYVDSVTVSLVEKSREEREKTPKPPEGAKYTQDFLTWYATYPEKVAKDAAFKAFQKAIQRTDLKTLLDGVERYKKHKPDDVKWKHPATWLNAGCWQDEYTTGEPEPVGDPELNRWKFRVDAWQKSPTKFWMRNQWGPPPDEPGFKGPPEFIQPRTDFPPILEGPRRRA